LHRFHDAKREAIIYDYVDMSVPALARMAAKRRMGRPSGRRNFGARVVGPDRRMLVPNSSGTDVTEPLVAAHSVGIDPASAFALNRHVERVFNPDRKDTHLGKRKAEVGR
jgi:hypothetical protein